MVGLGGPSANLSFLLFYRPGYSNWVSAANNWQTAAEGLKALDAVKYGHVVELSNTQKLEKALSAATAAKVLGGVRCVLGVLGGAVFVAGLISAFLPAQPDPQIMASLNTIQVVTNETLSRVKELQVSLGAVSAELKQLVRKGVEGKKGEKVGKRLG